MRKNNFALLLLLVFVFASCQKEIDWGINNGGGTSGTTLVKTVSKEAVDSAVTVYSYDANKRLINVKITGKSQGTDVGNEERIYRNAAGVITSMTQINNMLLAAGIDSTVTRINSSTSPDRYASKVSSLSLFGFSVMDSIVLVYNAAGKVVQEDTYQAIPFLSQPYELTLKVKYIYDAGGNISQTDTYSHDAATGVDDLASTIKYTFDSKTAAITLNNDAFAIGHPDWISLNNASKIEITSPTTPAANRTLNIIYTYNSNSRPKTGVNTQTPGPIVSNLTYYYQ